MHFVINCGKLSFLTDQKCDKNGLSRVKAPHILHIRSLSKTMLFVCLYVFTNVQTVIRSMHNR